MPQYHEDQGKRKSTGGKKRAHRKKRSAERGNDPSETIVGKRRASTLRTRGGNLKTVLLSDEYANVYNPKTGRTVKTRIIKTESSPANRDYDRRGVITKGTIIITEEGRARVLSRPGQHGVINARILES